MVFAIPAWASRVESFPQENQATVVRVVAQQFQWNVHYPGADGQFGRTDPKLASSENALGLDQKDPAAKDDIQTINQLVLPVDKPVIVHLSSQDVIHSFSLIQMRVKQDAIPGESIPVWFTPIVTGDWEINWLAAVRPRAFPHARLLLHQEPGGLRHVDERTGGGARGEPAAVGMG